MAQRRASGQFDKEEAAFFATIAAQLVKAIHDAATVGSVTRLLRGEAQGSAFILDLAKLESGKTRLLRGEAQGSAFIQGIQAAPGVAIGTLALLDPLADLESIPDRQAQDSAAEVIAFRTAVAAVQEELSASRERLVLTCQARRARCSTFTGCCSVATP